MISDLDFNGDGLISPVEFQNWWLAGRNGSTGNMSQLLKARLGGKKFISGMNETLTKLANQASKG